MEQTNNNKANIIKAVTAVVVLGVLVYKGYKLLNRSGLLKEFSERYKELKKSSVSLSKDVFDDQPEVAEEEVVVEKGSDNIDAEDDVLEDVSERGKKLLGYIKANKHLTMSDIRVKFSSVTARTLRRDLDKLEDRGLIEQLGKTRGSSYRYLGK